jgi:hypothetical protein
MRSSLTRLTTLAGIACAIAGTGPVASAAAAGPTPLTGPGCTGNQGTNLGPTGPLGPLGSKGPLGGNNTNLPGGGAACDLGPAGPLGPGGALGSTTSAAAPQSSPAPQKSPARQTTPGKKRGHGRHGAKRKTARH